MVEDLMNWHPMVWDPTGVGPDGLRPSGWGLYELGPYWAPMPPRRSRRLLLLAVAAAPPGILTFQMCSMSPVADCKVDLALYHRALGVGFQEHQPV